MRIEKRKIFVSLNYILFVLSIFVTQLSLHIRPGDDEIYKNSLHVYGNLWNWAVYYYHTWSGRVFPFLIEILVLQLPILCFSILNTVAIVWCIWFVCRYFINVKAKHFSLCLWGLWLIMFAFSNRGILNQTIFWCTASAIYFWGLAASFIVLRLYLKDEAKFTWLEKCVGGIAAVYAMGYEQSGIFTLCFCGVLYIRNIFIKKRINLFLLGLLVFSAVIFLLCLMAPGNANRTIVETLQRYPSFLTFTFEEKLLMGISFSITALRDYCDFILCGMAICLMVSFFIERKGSIGTILAGCCAGYYGMSFFWREGLLLIEKLRWLYEYADFEDMAVFFDVSTIVALFFGVFFFILQGCLIFAFDENKEWNWIGGLLYFAAFFEAMVICFSPTLHASSSRVIFYSHIFCLILLFCAMVRCVRDILKITGQVGRLVQRKDRQSKKLFR